MAALHSHLWSARDPNRDLLGEEIFGNFFARSAIRDRKIPKELLLSLQKSVATTGLDFRPCDDQILWQLSSLTKVSVDRLAEGLLQSYECLFAAEFTNELWGKRWNRRWPWVLNTQEDSKGNFPCGTQYCAICLSEEIVYFRKEWRLALFCCCRDIHHEAMLLDRCERCHEPVRPLVCLKVQSIADAIRLHSGSICQKCNCSLAQSPTKPAPLELLRKQRLLWRILGAGPAIRAEAGLYFLGMRSLLRLLLVRDGQGDRFRRSVSQLSGITCEDLQSKGSLWFETMAVDDRARLLQILNWLFIGWPDNFVAAFRNAQFEHPPNVSSIGDRSIPWLWAACHAEKRDASKLFVGSNRAWAPFAKALISE